MLCKRRIDIAYLSQPPGKLSPIRSAKGDLRCFWDARISYNLLALLYGLMTGSKRQQNLRLFQAHFGLDRTTATLHRSGQQHSCKSTIARALQLGKSQSSISTNDVLRAETLAGTRLEPLAACRAKGTTLPVPTTNDAQKTWPGQIKTRW